LAAELVPAEQLEGAAAWPDGPPTTDHAVGQLTRLRGQARHAWLWMRTLATLGLPSVRIRRTYQSFYLDEIPTPRTTIELQRSAC
jgi:hypothetical protein